MIKYSCSLCKKPIELKETSFLTILVYNPKTKEELRSFYNDELDKNDSFNICVCQDCLNKSQADDKISAFEEKEEKNE